MRSPNIFGALLLSFAACACSGIKVTTSTPPPATASEGGKVQGLTPEETPGEAEPHASADPRKKESSSVGGETSSLEGEGIPSVIPRPEYEGLILSEANNAFALDLYRQLSSTREGNVAISPLSLSIALSMTSAGAADDTLKEMEKTLRFSELADPAKQHSGFARIQKRLKSLNSHGNEFNLANRLYGQEKLKVEAAFQNTMRNDYAAPMELVDFSESEKVRREINLWVGQRTKAKIQELLPSGALDALTRVVLVNAVYMKAKWQQAFDKKKTSKQPFFVNAEKSKKVPMMSSLAGLEYGESEGAQVVSLPYRGERISMVLVLPLRKQGLAALEARLDLALLKQWIGSLKKDPKVRLLLPRFKARSKLEMKSNMEALGMVQVFSEAHANFSKLAKEEQLFVSEVFHEAVVEVDEEGTVAAAATAAVVSTKSARLMPHSFVANQPFLYLIRDNASGSILFMGRVKDPSL